MNFFRPLSKLLCCVIAAWIATAAHAQVLQITGIGLSGNRAVRDTLVQNGERVYGVISFVREPGMDVQGLALDENQFNLITVHYYPGNIPSGLPDSSLAESIIVDSTRVDTINSPNTVHFQFRILNLPPRQGMHSLQIETAIYGRDSTNVLRISEHRTSRATVNGVPPTINPVDQLHATYLRFRDTRVDPPEIISPLDSMVITRGLEVGFNLPETALPHTLILTFLDEDSTEPLHRIYLHNHAAGQDRSVLLNITNLSASQDVDSVSGPASLTHNLFYRLTLSYTDLENNIAVPDVVQHLHVDILTIAPDILLPDNDTESSETQIPVAFQIYEYASTVQLIFSLNSLSPVQDFLAPHVLTLANQFYAPQIHVFTLDGTSIGTNNPLIIDNHNGPEDSLVTQALYDVTISYSDSLNNLPSQDMNSGYMYPRDLATLRPDLIAPLPNIREDETFWVQFSLPEEALAGSVRLTFRAIGSPTDPGSPHTLFFGNLVAPGLHGIMLNAVNFIFSDLVTDVTGSGTEEQNNTLVHNGRYRLELQYRDAIGNAIAGDSLTGGFVIFDIATDAPQILLPFPGDSLSRSGTVISFNQSEDAIPGTLRLILAQTSGPEVDTLSPHTLFLSDYTAGFSKQIILQPGFLSSSTGTDSVQNDGPLIPLANYRMTIQYQDTLGNSPASAFIDGLHMITGAAVLAEGHNYNISADPGQQIVAFQLVLRTFVGSSTLRGLHFLNDGTLEPNDLVWNETRLWASVDSIFDPQTDTPLEPLTDWTGNTLAFTNFGYGLTEFETHIFAVLHFTVGANPLHTINFLLLNPESVDCGGDPVFAATWPIGHVEVALPVQVTSFVADQDTAFGALRLTWYVASELNNEGFNILRRSASEDSFSTVASFTNTPALAGRGTAPTGHTYTFTDQNLIPGITYSYRLEAVSSNGFQEVLLDFETSGTPRIPPDDFILSSAYPNPFNQDVTIEYVVPHSAVVELFIYDVNGRLVRSLVRALQAASLYKARWDSRNDQGFAVPSGIYFYRLRAGGTFDQTRKLLLIR